jgi:hypothetical protein
MFAMRLLALKAIACLLATTLLATAFASPIDGQKELGLDQDINPLSKRTSQNAIQIQSVEHAGDTFAGVKPLSRLFNAAFTDQQMLQIAKDTFYEWDANQGIRDKRLLVAVVSIPGHGLVAGTIWHGTPEYFKEQLQADAPNLWTLCQRQQLRESGLTASLWHAEVVALWMAERSFPQGMQGSKWPTGTKIAVFGREAIRNLKGERELITHYKPVCDPASTTNRIPCTRLL